MCVCEGTEISGAWKPTAVTFRDPALLSLSNESTTAKSKHKISKRKSVGIIYSSTAFALLQICCGCFDVCSQDESNYAVSCANTGAALYLAPPPPPPPPVIRPSELDKSCGWNRFALVHWCWFLQGVGSNGGTGGGRGDRMR